MSKYFFHGDDDEKCYLISHYKQMLNKGDSLELVEAEMERDTDHFYCKEFQEVGLKSEGGCGKECEFYSPINGKNGRCKHSANCYTPSENKIILTRIDDKRYAVKRSVATEAK